MENRLNKIDEILENERVQHENAMKELHDEANLRVENEVTRKQEEYDMFQKQKDEEYQRMIKEEKTRQEILLNEALQAEKSRNDALLKTFKDEYAMESKKTLKSYLAKLENEFKNKLKQEQLNQNNT